MTVKRFSYLLLLGATVLGCSKDTDGEAVEPTITAGLRYVNLIPDSIGLDIRVVDIVGAAPNTVAATFRSGGQPFGVSTTGFPMHFPVLAGSRQIRVFLSSANPDTASQSPLETTFDFQANTNYTMYLEGYLNPVNGTPAARATILADIPADPGAGNIGVRVSNFASNLAPTLASATVDVWIDGLAAGAAPVGAPTFAAVAPNSQSTYATRAVGAARAVVAATGTVTPRFEVAIPAGTTGNSTSNPIPGALVAGTVVNVLVTPRSVAGTGAPQAAAFQVPAALTIFDRLPARTAP